MITKWLCVAVSLSSLALAQTAGPVVMPFPLELKRTPPGLTQEDRDSLQREFTRLLRLSGAKIPDFVRYDVALKELKRQDCEREDECLAQLAKKAEALYALYGSLDTTLEGGVQVSGRVVRDDGKVASPTQIVKLAKEEKPFKDQAMRALAQLFTQLKIGELPPERPVEAKEPIATITPIVPTVRLVEDRGAGQRTVGRAVLIVGAAGVAAGGVMFAVSQVIGGGLTPDKDGNVPVEQVGSFQSARTLSNAGAISLAAGGATAIVGALIWGLAPSAPAKLTVSATALPQGGLLSVQGAF